MKVIISILNILLIINVMKTLAQLLPRRIHCLDQTSTECYIVNTFLPKNNSYFKPVSSNQMNVVSLKFESSVIPRLSSEICKSFPNLRTFNAMKSMVEIIDEDTFAGCTNLDFIDFGHNKISHLDKNTFNRNRALKTLSLHDNDLEVIDPDLFRDLPNLKRLVLSMNDLREIPIEAFRDLKNLRELTLHHNQLSDFDAEQLVQYCPKLSMIHIRDNDFKCDRMVKMIDVLTQANVSFWDYADKLRPRNYSVEFINRMECLNDVQFDMEMKMRKNMTSTIMEMEKELEELKVEVKEAREEKPNNNNYWVTIVIGLLTLAIVVIIFGYLMIQRIRRQRRQMTNFSERMVIVGTDFSN